MLIKKENPYEFQVSRQQMEDIEAHCRRIHADAVVDSFIIFFTVPMKLFYRIIQARKKKQVDKIQAVSY